MGRVALVTGGTRGIGRAICEDLKANGYTVAANFAGNIERAKAFNQETGIPIYQFDVGDFAATKAAIDKIVADLGPIEVLVFNVGGNVRFPVLETTAQKYFKVWEMCALAGFLAGREAADHSMFPLLTCVPLTCRRQSRSILRYAKSACALRNSDGALPLGPIPAGADLCAAQW